MSVPGALTSGELARARPPAVARPPSRVRQRFELAAAGLVLLGPAAMLANALLLPDAVAAPLFLAWIGGVPIVGLVLLLYAAAERDARGVRALLLSIVGLALSVASLDTVAAAGQEAFVSRHGTELDALARDILAAPEEVHGLAAGRTLPQATAADSARVAAAETTLAALRERAGRLGLSDFEAAEGAVWLRSTRFLNRSLLYRDAASTGISEWCKLAELRMVGPGWYLFRCLRHVARQY